MKLSDTDKLLVYDEAVILFNKVADEYQIPPALTCIHLSAFCISNLLGLYKKEGIEPPKALKKFIKKTYPQLLLDFKDVVEVQYLHLNTEGTA